MRHFSKQHSNRRVQKSHTSNDYNKYKHLFSAPKGQPEWYKQEGYTYQSITPIPQFDEGVGSDSTEMDYTQSFTGATEIPSQTKENTNATKSSLQCEIDKILLRANRTLTRPPQDNIEHYYATGGIKYPNSREDSASNESAYTML